MHGVCGSLHTCTKLQCCEARRASDSGEHVCSRVKGVAGALACLRLSSRAHLEHVLYVAWPAVQLAYMHMLQCCSLFL